MTTGREMITVREKAGRERTTSTSRQPSRVKSTMDPVSHSLRSSASKKPSSPKEEQLDYTDTSESPSMIDELSKTVRRLEKGFLSLADAVIAEIEGMRDDARAWQQVRNKLMRVSKRCQEEREELWKTVIAFHGRDSDMEPITRRLEGLEKRACDIEKHLQSRDPDTKAPANNRLDELEQRAHELEKQVKKQQAYLFQAPQMIQEKPASKEEGTPRSNLVELQKLKLEGSRCLMATWTSDPEEVFHAVRREIEDLNLDCRNSHGDGAGDRRTTSQNGELQQTELQYNVSAITHDLHKLQVWCKLFENDQAMRLQRFTDSMMAQQ